MPRASLSLLATLFLIGACGSDLPGKWKDATRVDGLTQAECAGSPLEGNFEERLEAGPIAGGIQVDYREAHFRCEQEVEAFELREGAMVEVLVQPVDMHPGAVASCDCLYEIGFALVDLSGEQTLTLYRRWDELNDPNDPVLIGSQAVTIP